MSEQTPLERREVYFAGRVQGVGFRYTTRRIAARLPVGGFVRNLPDGRVHLVAEAEAAVLDEFLERIQQALGHCIQAVDPATHDPTGGFTDFEIRH